MELEHKGDDSRPSALQIENNSFDDEERCKEEKFEQQFLVSQCHLKFRLQSL